MKKQQATVPGRIGRPPLTISDEERAERLAMQRAAALGRFRERVVYISVPFSPEMADWVDAQRAKERPIPGRGPFVAAIITAAKARKKS